MARIRKNAFLIPATKCPQHDDIIYMIDVNRSWLDEDKHIVYPLFDGDSMAGFQRQEIPDKIDSITEYSLKGGVILSRICMNLVTKGKKGQVEWHPGKENPHQGFISCNGEYEFKNFDGQHTIKGLFAALRASDELNVCLPAMVTINWPDYKCLHQFLGMNSAADRVSRDLLIEGNIALGKLMAKEDAELPACGKINYSPRMTQMFSIINILNTRRDGPFAGNVWVGKIAPCNIRGDGRKRTLRPTQYWFRRASMCESYACLVSSHNECIMPVAPADKALVLCNLWKALSGLVPAAFKDEAQEYNLVYEYFIHKVLGTLLPAILHKLHKDGTLTPKQVPTVESFSNLLKECGKGQPEGKARTFTNEFWKKGGENENSHGHVAQTNFTNKMSRDMDLPEKVSRKIPEAYELSEAC
jgi:hypothetical protein